MSKIPQKILKYRFERADSKNLAFLWSWGKILDILGSKYNFFSMGNFGKMLGVIEETKGPSGGRNVQENVFG